MACANNMNRSIRTREGTSVGSSPGEGNDARTPVHETISSVNCISTMITGTKGSKEGQNISGVGVTIQMDTDAETGRKEKEDAGFTCTKE